MACGPKILEAYGKVTSGKRIWEIDNKVLNAIFLFKTDIGFS